MLLIVGCKSNETYFGSTYSGFDGFPKTEIDIDKAIELSEPYLESTFILRKKNRNTNSTKEPVIWVTLKDNWYYIVKDNYPSYTPNFYLRHAVRINSKNGEIIKPN